MLPLTKELICGTFDLFDKIKGAVSQCYGDPNRNALCEWTFRVYSGKNLLFTSHLNLELNQKTGATMGMLYPDSEPILLLNKSQ